MRRFKTPNRGQLMLLPPNLNDWVAENHPARFVVDFIANLDLSDFYNSYAEDGQPPYDPAMMLSILLYANMRGISSSRKIECALCDDIGLRFIGGGLQPDHDTIAEFRVRHRSRMKNIFVSCVQLAVKAGAVGLTHVAIDGTKIRANAAQDARKSDKQVLAEIQQIERFVGKYLDNADKVDQQEDMQFGKGNNGYLLPDFLKDEEQRKAWIKEQLGQLKVETKPETTKNDKGDDDEISSPRPKNKIEKKLQKLRKAKAVLEANERKRKEADPTGKRERDGDRKRGKPFVPKINITDPDAGVMLFRDLGCQDGYNGQIAVDNEAGIIVAADLTQDANDLRQLAPMLRQTQQNTGWLPEHVSADTGYFNLQQMEDLRFKSVEFYIPPRARSKKEGDHTKSECMREKLETDLGKAIYAARKAIVEPVFGAIKHARKFRQLLGRGQEMTKAEWWLVCITHNLLKLHKMGAAPA